MNAFLADVIWWFHLFVVLFVLLAPFSSTPYILLLHFVFCVSLLVHWAANSNSCSLSLLESQLRGVPYTKSFSHQFIAPIYDVSKTSWSNFLYTITFFVMFVSFYKLYRSNSFSNFQQSWLALKKSDTASFADYIQAFHSAFF
jgi:serine/threonine protein kinase